MLCQLLRILTDASRRQLGQTDVTVPRTADDVSVSAVGHELGLEENRAFTADYGNDTTNEHSKFDTKRRVNYLCVVADGKT